MWLTLISLLKNSVPFLEAYWKPLFVSFAIICSGIGGCQQGMKWKQREWDAEKSEVAKQISQNNTDNTILGATILGGNYVWKTNLTNELNNANSVSTASFSDLYSSATSKGINGCADSSGISAAGTSTAEARDSSIKEAIIELEAINRERNADASHAKSNTLTLMDLQRFDRERK